MFGVTLAGYLLADVIGDSIDKYLLPIIAVIIIISLIPPFLEWRKAAGSPHTVTRRAKPQPARPTHCTRAPKKTDAVIAPREDRQSSDL